MKLSLWHRRTRPVLVFAFGALLLWPLFAVGLVGAADPSFTDPTATITNSANVTIGSLVFIGPFANVRAGSGAAGAIHIGDESNIQDNVVVDATLGPIAMGEMVILAHGATVLGPAELGEHGTCPGGAQVCPSFVGFNAVVAGAKIEKDAMVGHLALVAPGVTIPSGRKVLPGKMVASNAEVATKTAPLVEADRVFMDGVIHVNVNFAKGYAQLAGEDSNNVRGVNYDSGPTATNEHRDLPKFAGKELRDPTFRNRIIGDVSFSQTLPALAAGMGNNVSLRADEGEEWHVGSVSQIGDRSTWHALEETHLDLGDDGKYGIHSVIHGGPTPYQDTTVTGKSFQLGAGAVFFRSRAGDNVVVGARSLVQQSDLANGTTIPAKTIYIENATVGTVEWDESQLPTPGMPGLPSTGNGGGNSFDERLAGSLAASLVIVIAGCAVLQRRRATR